jgi:multicomponent K+:H+ antiporter subunit G
MLEILISLFLLIGSVFALIGSLGVGGILIASALHFSSRGDGLSLHELLVTLFLLSTAPISAFLIARAMLHLRGEGAHRRDTNGSSQL